MWDLRALRSPLMRAKEPRSQAVHEMRGLMSVCLPLSTKISSCQEKGTIRNRRSSHYGRPLCQKILCRNANLRKECQELIFKRLT